MRKLLTRDVVLQGPAAEVGRWATDVAAGYGRATGRSVAVWTSIAGGRAGHFTFSLPVEGAADVVSLGSVALGDDAYVSTVEEGRAYVTGPPHDTIYRSYSDHGFDDDAIAPDAVAIATTATSKAGSLGHAVGWGLEAAEYVQQLTGVPTTLMGNAAGRFSTLTWLAIASSVEEADAFEEATNADDGYLKLIARGGGYFADGSARTQLFLRIG